VGEKPNGINFSTIALERQSTTTLRLPDASEARTEHSEAKDIRRAATDLSGGGFHQRGVVMKVR
jgi:hypothetical protein